MNYIIFEFKLDSSTFFCDMSLLGSEPEGRTSTDFLTSAEQQRVKQITKDQQLNSKPDKPQTTQSFKNNPQEITHTTQKKKPSVVADSVFYTLLLSAGPISCSVTHLSAQSATHTCSTSHTISDNRTVFYRKWTICTRATRKSSKKILVKSLVLENNKNISLCVLY